MNCRQVDRVLVRHLYGGLSERAGREVEAHLAGCADCRCRFDSFRRNRADITTLTSARPAASPAQAAVRRWNAEGRQTVGASRVDWRWPLAWGAGLAVCVALVILVVLSSRQSGHPLAVRTKSPVSVTPHLAQERGASDLQGPEPGDRLHPEVRLPNRPRMRTPSRGLDNVPFGSRGDDLAYINADPVRTIQGWAVSPPADPPATAVSPTPLRDTDDFVTIAPPRIASTDPRAVKAAMAKYRQEKAIVDARLDKKVDLAVKGIAFIDLCKQLSAATGIQLRAARNVADEKVTIFCEQQPLREIMRQITHVFGYTWERSGEENAFQYLLSQSVKLQIAEQTLRDQDLSAALAGLDKALEVYKPLQELSQQELMERLRAAQQPIPDDLKREETSLQKAGAPGALIAVEMFNQLTPAERGALLNGQELEFKTGDGNGPGVLSQEMSRRLLESFGEVPITPEPSEPPGTPYKNIPGVQATITLA
ncbi:MAG TPA: zf-HC2 domain-containing protein, partial [Chthonomonadaceae bacterium]|nr:zf-HC2 domain-containing protein [Chthonomonadaceae bacterium]